MLAEEQLETGGTTMEPATRFDKPWLFDWLADGNKPRLPRRNTLNNTEEKKNKSQVSF